jgi:hypothetical protein
LVKRASCPVLSYSVVSLEDAVGYSGSNLQHHMRSPRRPAHLLIRTHPAMKQPLHGAFARRCRNWLRSVTCRRIVDDQFRLPIQLRLKPAQKFDHLAPRSHPQATGLSRVPDPGRLYPGGRGPPLLRTKLECGGAIMQEGQRVAPFRRRPCVLILVTEII